MQGRIYSDMVFHDAGPSEDCLYLNLWRPEHAAAKLPVMVWIFGGGFAAGSTSEPRQDGGNLCKKGVLVVSLGYRLGVFGYLALPELSRESAYGGSGDYGLMDQVAALEWVKRNIAAFGGDPDNVTIFGESAGSFSVSALVSSPLARGLFHRAIGESGAFFADHGRLLTLAEAEASGQSFAAEVGRPTLAALRAASAGELIAAAVKHPVEKFWPDVDGHYLDRDCAAITAAGQQAHVALLAGWNRDEQGFGDYFKGAAPTLANYVAIARAKFGDRAADFLRAYAATTDAEARRAAQDFQGDQFIAYGTWRWLELHRASSGQPAYRYEFDQPLPLPADAKPGTEPTASHSWEIEYVFRVLSSKPLPWRPEDRAVSEQVSSYWTNFARTGNPNGPGLPFWPDYRGADGDPVMHLSPASQAEPDRHRARAAFIASLPRQPQAL
jgi:para-nitrobenzyl esterase